MINEIELQVHPQSLNCRYPWDLLAEVGSELVLTGRWVQPWNVREMAYRLAKRRGWKLSIRQLGPKRMLVMRMN